jgi:carbonic anhydrase
MPSAEQLPLSPIILSKKYSNEEKININAILKRDPFTIYLVIKDKGKGKGAYCKKITDYLDKNKQSTNNYYKCDGCTNQSQNEILNKYLVIEFIESSSIINIDNSEYKIKKITFHAPAYHYVNDDNDYNNDTFPTKGDSSVNRELLPTNSDGLINNCLEIELLCETSIGTSLSISILCNTYKNDDITANNIDKFTDSEGTSRKFFGIIYKYINANQQQLSSGGFKDKSLTLDIHDLLPSIKHFYKYNGTLFELTDLNNTVTNTTRIVFKNSITIPNMFFNKIQDLILHSNDKCNAIHNLNHFIDYIPQKHQLIFSDTNIDFISDNKRRLKKTDWARLAVFIFFIVLILMSILYFMWKEGLLEEILRGIFEKNPLILRFFDQFLF